MFPSLKGYFFPLTLLTISAHTQKEPCPGNSPKVSRALFPTVHSALPGRQQILTDPQLRVPRDVNSPLAFPICLFPGLPIFLLQNFVIFSSLPIEKDQALDQGCFFFCICIGASASRDASMPVSACTIMATSQVKIIVAIVELWPCHTSLHIKQSFSITLVNLERSNV